MQLFTKMECQILIEPLVNMLPTSTLRENHRLSFISRIFILFLLISTIRMAIGLLLSTIFRRIGISFIVGPPRINPSQPANVDNRRSNRQRRSGRIRTNLHSPGEWRSALVDLPIHSYPAFRAGLGACQSDAHCRQNTASEDEDAACKLKMADTATAPYKPNRKPCHR